MPFDQVDSEKKLEEYQAAMSLIREGRSGGNLRLLELRNMWRNSIVTVSFGIFVALIALGASAHFKHAYQVYAYWIGTSLILFDALFSTFYIKLHLESDSNDTSLLMFEQEYDIGLIRNLYRASLATKTEVNDEEKSKILSHFKKISNQESKERFNTMEKISVADDIFIISLVLGLFCTAIALVPIPSKYGFVWIVAGTVALILLAVNFCSSYKNAKNTAREHIKWAKKINSLNNP